MITRAAAWLGCPFFSRRQKWLAVVLVICGSVCGSGTAPAQDSANSQYVRTNYTLDDGLPDNTVETIAQTGNGLLWVGTQSGLASFDGKTFTHISLRIPGALPPSDITSLVESSNGDLWVGSDAGVVRIPKMDLGDPYLVDAETFRLGERNSDEVETLMQARNGTIWAGTNHGLYKFDGKRFLSVLPSVYVSRIHEGVDGRLLLITGNSFIEYADGRTILHPGLGAKFGVHDNQIFDAFQSADGTMWFGTNFGIRAVKAGKIAVSSPWQPAHTSTSRILTGPAGAIWVSTGVGLYRVSPHEMSTPAPGLVARAFHIGKDGDIWIGTNGSGLVHLHPRLVQMYTTANGLPFNNIVMAVLPTPEGHLWVGTNCGLTMFDGSRFHPFSEKDGLKNSCVWSLAKDHENNIWIGTYGGGLFRYRNGVFTQYSMEQGLVSRIVFAVRVARDDSLWIATPDGLSHLQNGTIRNYTTADGLSSDRILDVHQDRTGVIWIATQGGVDRLVAGRFVALPASQGAAEVLARRFVEDSKGGLYTTDSPQGVSQIRNNQLQLVNGTLDLTEDVETPDGSLWFTSRGGVARFQEQEFEKENHRDRPLSYELFNRNDGLNTTQASVGTPNIAATPDGKIWVATVAGLAMINTSLLPDTGRRPRVFVAGVSTDGAPNRIGSELVLRPGVHHIELNLAAVSPANPQKVRLQYLLEDVDSGWLDADSSRVAVYTGIPAGTHRMLVRETDTLGNWSAPEVIYRVTQRPHFYATTLFQLSAAIALLLVVLTIYAVRVRHMVRRTRVMLEQRQLERESVARDLHDTFLQGVQGLILRFHTGTQQLSQDHPVRARFEEALDQSDRLILEGRNVLSRLRSRQTRPENLTEAYAAIGIELSSLGAAHFEVLLGGRSRNIDAVAQEELLKIGREALFNAWRHAHARNIEVEVHFGFFDFRIHFRDDGIGIEPAILRAGRITGHYGLPGMRERTAKLGGRMVLWSRPGAGTEIEIRIPAVIAYRQEQRRTPAQWIQSILKSRA